MDQYLKVILLLVPTCGIIYHRLWLNKVLNWLKSKINKAQLLLQIVNNLNSDKMISSSCKTKDSFKVNDSDASACITYQRLGKEYILQIPYQRSYVASMVSFKAQLLKEDNCFLDITQEPGVPYVVSAENLGGKLIRVINNDTGDFYDYINGSIPMYATEVME